MPVVRRRVHSCRDDEQASLRQNGGQRQQSSCYLSVYFYEAVGQGENNLGAHKTPESSLPQCQGEIWRS